MPLLIAFTQLLLFQLVGELITGLTHLPIPAPVLGFALLFLFLIWQGEVNANLQHTCNHLLQNLSLLFIPAGAGVMLHWHRLQEELLALSVAVVISTVIGMLITALVLKMLLGKQHLN